MDEDTPLTRPYVNRPSYGWWALQIGLVVLVFLAFLFSALSYSTSNKTNQQITNSYWSTSSMRHTYKVNAARSVRKGSVVSFCEEHRICEGLGPVWNHRSFSAPGGETAAAFAGLVQLSPSIAAYVWASVNDHTLLRVATISTIDEPGIRGYAYYQLQYPLASLRVRSVVDHSLTNSFVVMYTDHNVTYIQVGTAWSASNITFGDPIQLYTLDSTANYTYVSDIQIAETWIIITYGESGQGSSNYLIYELDHSASTRLKQISYTATSFNIPPRGLISSAYLGNGSFIQSCANHMQIGLINFTTASITLLKDADFSSYFRTLHITPIHGNRIAFTGVQVDYVDEPVTLSMVVEHYPYAPYLSVYYPTNLLATHSHQLVNYQLHVCYHTPTNSEPYGGLFFTYVDALSLMAKIVRAKVVQTSYSQIQLLPSPALDLSSAKYGTYGSWFAPLISCPTSNEEILMAYQDYRSMFDTFTWNGGYRFAGVAETEGKEGEEVSVVRQGVAGGLSELQTGFQYYVYNDGYLAPHTSYLELFTPNGHREHVGVAISPTELLLETDAFEPRD